jgi:hypothetical protein
MRSLPALALALAVAAALAPPAVAQQQKAPTVTGAIVTEPGRGTAAAVVEATATVTAVKKDTREVTLKMPKGDLQTIQVGEEVRNFDQVKVGDTLKVKYAEALTLELKKGGKAVLGATGGGSLDRSRAGQKPGGVVRREVKVVADVVAVDEATMKVSVKNAQGETYILPLRDPAQVRLVKVGDQVEATYSEGLALSMEPAAAAPAKAAPKKDSAKKDAAKK